jgi:diadenosine tetraphosphate (Ap4A) HIT family hydrolase
MIIAGKGETVKDGCFVCGRIKQVQEGTNQYFVAELPSGYVALGDFQFYSGYTVFISKVHATELHELSKVDRSQFLEDMAIAAEAVFNAFHPLKLNYELLGNLDSHMHWHIFPRYADDPDPKNPVSVIPPEVRNAESTRPTPEQLSEMKDILRQELSKLTQIN